MHLIAATWDWLAPVTWLYILMAALGLGFVIFVHELGHFLVAKLCGVKCEKFYIGFDVPIKIGFGRYGFYLPAALWKRKWGETEYGIGAIPLGGYVKMLGQDDNPSHATEAMEASRAGTSPDGAAQLDPRSYPAKSVPARMAIISAGVVMNVIFAYIFAVAAILVGIPYVPCIVGHTQPGDAAWRADIRPRDEIIEINGLKNPRFDDLQLQVLLADPEEGINVRIRRPEEGRAPSEFSLTLEPSSDFVGPRKLPRIGVAMEATNILNPNFPTVPFSVAGRLPQGKGFRGGDRIVSIDGVPVADSVDYEAVLARNPGKSLVFEVERAKQEQPKAEPERLTIEVPPSAWHHLGMAMTMGPITAVQSDSPAAKAKSADVEGGLREGDRITAIDGQPVGDPLTLPMRLADRAGKTVRIEILRRDDHNTASKDPRKLEFTTTLVEPTWFTEVPIPDSPVAVLALGATYSVVPKVTEVDAGGPAEKSGIAPGDQIVKAEFLPPEKPETDAEKKEARAIKELGATEFGPEDYNWAWIIGQLQDSGPKTRVRLTVAGGGKTRIVDLAPTVSEEFFIPSRGIILKSNEQPLVVHSISEAATFAWRETKGKLLAVYVFLKKLAYQQISVKMLGGPLTIATAAGMSAQAGVGKLLLFLTLLSANLAVVNFLPIPVLDGGHMVFLLWEGIFRRPMPEKLVVPLTYAGLFLILSLMVLVFGLDIHRFWPF